jgi:hypothetical protein
MTLAPPLQGTGSWLTLHNFGLQPFQLGTVYFEFNVADFLSATFSLKCKHRKRLPDFMGVP